METLTMNNHTPPPFPEYDQAQAEFALLPNDAPKKRAALTRKLHFLVMGESAIHFLTHSRKHLRQDDPQLSCVLDAEIAKHPIFGEFDSFSATRWRFVRSRCSIQTSKTYPHLRLYKAVELEKRHDELPRRLVATTLDGNTEGSYPGNVKLGPRQRGGGSVTGHPIGPRKTKKLSRQSYNDMVGHRACMDAIADDGARAAYARRQGFIPVTLIDGKSETVHLLTGSVPKGTLGYVPFPADMTMEKLLKSGPGINPATYTIAMDTHGYALISTTERIDIAKLVWLIASGVKGLHRGTVLNMLRSAPAVIGFHDGNPRNLRLANLKARAGR